MLFFCFQKDAEVDDWGQTAIPASNQDGVFQPLVSLSEAFTRVHSVCGGVVGSGQAAFPTRWAVQNTRRAGRGAV